MTSVRVLGLPATLGFAVAYVLLVLVGRATVLPGSSVSLVGPAAGVAVLWLLAERPDRQARVLLLAAGLLGVVLAVTGADVPLVILGGAGVAVQTWLVVALLRRWCPTLIGAGDRDSVHTLRTLAVGIAAVLVGCAVGALLLTLALWVAGDAPDLVDAVLVWGRQVAGTIVIGSVGHLAWEWRRGHADQRVGGGGRTELAVLWGTSAAAVVAMFLQPLPLVFLLVPLTGWCASRFTTFTAALHACALGTVALVLTADGHGPIARLARRHLPGDEQRALASLVDLLDHPTRPSA